MRDLDRLVAAAHRHGPNVGIYAERLLDDPMPWTRMRTVYRLLGLARRYGADPVNTACARALDVDVVSVTKIASMLEKAAETATAASRHRVRRAGVGPVRPRPGRVRHPPRSAAPGPQRRRRQRHRSAAGTG